MYTSKKRDNLVINKKLLYMYLIYFLIIITVFFRGPTFFNLFPTSLGNIRLNYLIVFFLFLLNIKLNRKNIIFIITVLFILFSNMLFNSSNFKLDYLIYTFQAIAYYFIWINIVNEKFIYKIFSINNMLLIVLETMAIFEALFGKLLFHSSPPYNLNTIYSEYGRSYLFFYNSNNLSLFLLSLYILTLGYNLNKKRHGKYILFHFVMLISLFIINDSKLSLLILVISTVFFVFKTYLLDIKNKNLKNIIITTCMITGVFIWLTYYIVNNYLLFNNFINVSLSNIYYDTRFQIYLDAIETFLNNPFGIGLGYSDYYFSTNVHSFILQLIVELGITGVIVWIIYFGAVLKLNLNDLNLLDKFIASSIKYYILLFPVISIQVSRVISDNALICIWALYIAILRYYSNNNSILSKENHKIRME